MIFRINKKYKTITKLDEAYDPTNFAITSDSDDFLKKINSFYKSAKEASGETITDTGIGPVGSMNQSTINPALLGEFGMKGIEGAKQAIADPNVKKELQKIAVNTNNGNIVWGDWNTFIDTFKETIAEELGLSVSYSSYSAHNKKNEDGPTDVIFPGSRSYTLRDIPKILVYLDQSGSWHGTWADEVASQILAALVQLDTSAEAADFLDDDGNLSGSIDNFKLDGDEIDLEILFFANHVHSNKQAAIGEGGTRAWPYILKDIKAKDANNVIIISDTDCGRTIERYGDNSEYGGYLTVPGSVWYIWGEDACVTDGNGRYGNEYNDLMLKHLHSEDPGRTFQYFLSEAGIG